MKLTIDNDDINALAEIIAKEVVERIKVCVPEKTSEAVKEAKTEAKKEESGLSLEQVIKAVKDYTLKDKDGAKKLKPILQSLGVARLSLLPNDKLPEFVEGIRKEGVEI